LLQLIGKVGVVVATSEETSSVEVRFYVWGSDAPDFRHLPKSRVMSNGLVETSFAWHAEALIDTNKLFFVEGDRAVLVGEQVGSHLLRWAEFAVGGGPKWAEFCDSLENWPKAKKF
jgi:hypothetical protein